MHFSISLSLWALFFFLLYKFASYVSTELRHRNNARRLGCKTPQVMAGRDPIGIDNVMRLMKADREFRLPDYIRERSAAICAKEGRQINTFYQNVLGSPAIFTHEPENVKTILATKFKDFGLGESRNNNFFPLLGFGIFSTDGKAWEHSRGLLRPQFAREQVSDIDLEEKHIQHMMRCLRPNPDGWTDVINIQTLFFRLTMDTATEFLFGQSVDSQLANLPGYPTATKDAEKPDEAQFAIDFDVSQQHLSKAARMGDMYWISHNKEFRESCKRCHDFIDYYVRLALNKEKTNEKETATGKPRYVFLDALAEDSRDPMVLRSQLISILLAGRDTTASLLSYVFVMLIQHPAVFNKLRETIIEEFGTYSNSKEISFSGLKNTAYLQWVLNETLRLFPLVPFNSRRALKDTTLPTGGGPDGLSPVYVRAGQQVDYSVAVVQRRVDLWGPDADEFKPERWDGRRAGWEYLPFNGGPRICIGQQFALTEAGYAVVRLLQRFDKLDGPGNSWEPVEKGGYGFVRQAVTLTSCPADGVKLRLREAKE